MTRPRLAPCSTPATPLVFSRIEPYAGTYVQALGEYTDAAGHVQRAAISIGPEHGTVDAAWVKEAAKEARKGEGFPVLVVFAFAFDPCVGEEARQWPDLTGLITRMNPDLPMDTADQKPLESTGAGNLFVVLGGLDVESFFVRHAHFTGADQPYEKLQRALKAEIDEAAWSSLYSTVSRPFDPPSTGKIAVKVINH